MCGNGGKGGNKEGYRARPQPSRVAAQVISRFKLEPKK